MTKLYVAVIDEFPDFMVPTLVAHSVLGAHVKWTGELSEEDLTPYLTWMEQSFKKSVVRVNRKEFEKISQIPNTYLGHENKTLNGEKSCAIPIPIREDELLPNVLKFAKLWAPKPV